MEHLPMLTLVKGDATSTCISAASVIAKVSRPALQLAALLGAAAPALAAVVVGIDLTPTAWSVQALAFCHESRQAGHRAEHLRIC